MTTAVNEILKQVELLSPEEQRELALKLMELARQNTAALSPNAGPAKAVEAGAPAQPDAAEDDEDWLDVFSPNHAPPKDTFEIKVRFVDGGRGQPRRYDFGDLFDDEEETVGVD